MQQGIDNLADPIIEQVEALQERVADLTARLEHTERLATLGTIAGLIAHEFNNILTPVMSYAQLALANEDDLDLVRKALQKAADGSDQASQIAAAILGFVRTDSGSGGDAPGADVEEAVGSALGCIGRDLAKDRIALHIDVPRGTSVAMRPVALRHVIVNLVLNARNAMLPRGGSLTIKTRHFDRAPATPTDAVIAPAPPADGRWSVGTERGEAMPSSTPVTGTVVLSIQDSGAGMDTKRLSNIFEPYHSSYQDRTNLIGGTGLGLTTCLRLIAEAGGSLWIQSRPQAGTTVSVALPAAAAPAEAPTAPLRQVA